MKFFKVVITCLAICVGCARESDEPWYGGTPDTNELAQRSHLYEYYFEDVEKSLGQDIRSDELARMRIVNLVNKAIKDWNKYKNKYEKDRYHLEVRYLVTGDDGLRHYEFIMVADQMLEKVH